MGLPRLCLANLLDAAGLPPDSAIWPGPRFFWINPFWLCRRGLPDRDLFVLEPLTLFDLARQQERVRNRRLSLLDAGNDVRAADPMRFREIGRGPLRRVVGMRMVEPHNIPTLRPAFPLDLHQFAGRDVIAVLRRI